MTTQSWATRVRHDSDATFREWGAEMNARLAACGLVQTADTGQINWTTVLRPGTNTSAGYEIWRFADSLQASAPIYIRIDYGTHGVATGPRMQFTVGTGTNGAGTLTGTALTIARNIMAANGQTTDTGRNSYACHAEGFFGLGWKLASGSDAFFFVCRTCDSAGAPTVTGAMVYWGNTNANGITATQALRFAATAAAYTARTQLGQAALCLSPQCPASTLVGADIQAMVCWTITPQVAPLFGVCGVLDTEVADGATFSVAVVGSTARTYIAMAGEAPIGPDATGNNSPKLAFLWE